MQYTKLGNTGYTVSRLGFGSMRLPMTTIGGKEYVDVERAIQVIHRALELGVNYVDTGFLYCQEESELVVGTALEQWPRRDEVVVAAKCTKFRMEHPGDMRRMLEHQLWRQRRDHFDLYLFHGIGWDNWHEIDAKTGWFDDMRRAQDEGLVRHVGMSFHDTPENMIRLIDTGRFELVTCQYNYLDRVNEEAMAYAHDKGLGVVVMGPVGGGRLSIMPRKLRELAGLNATSAAELGANSAASLALRFVWSHPGVNVAISGMGSIEVVEQNCAAAEKGPLGDEEAATLKDMMEGMRELARLYCTGCGYCLPCPNGVNIPRVFELANYYRVYGLEDYALEQYRALVAGDQDAGQCVECGECLERCPQHIEIPEQLREAAGMLG
jgi:predicted aldo/keto reductase-like oxidoreductase